jgi:hypothetical protein
MGLDGVDLVLGVEEAFGISISDEEAASIRTPRQLTDLVMAHLATAPSAACLSQISFHRLRRSLIADFGISRPTVKPDSSWQHLLPSGRRPEHWKKLSESLRLVLPPLERPGWMLWLMLIVSVAAGLWIYSLAGSALAILATFSCGACLAVLTSPARQAFPASCRSVGTTARYLAATAPAQFKAPSEPWSRAQVRSIVDGVIREVLGVSEVPEDADSVEDLGLS